MKNMEKILNETLYSEGNKTQPFIEALRCLFRR